jgi:hypothetical protein
MRTVLVSSFQEGRLLMGRSSCCGQQGKRFAQGKEDEAIRTMDT